MSRANHGRYVISDQKVSVDRNLVNEYVWLYREDYVQWIHACFRNTAGGVVKFFPSQWRMKHTAKLTSGMPSFWVFTAHYMICCARDWLICFLHMTTLQDIVINLSLQIRILRYSNIFAVVWYLANIKLVRSNRKSGIMSEILNHCRLLSLINHCFILYKEKG